MVKVHLAPSWEGGALMSTPTLQRALDYADKGYYVLPLCWPDEHGACACGRGHTKNEIGKAPLTPRGYLDATRDRATIQRWFSQDFPDANIGYDTKQSGILDIASDCPEWARQFKANGMPPTTLYRSGKGWHALYRRPKDCPVARICVPNAYDLMSEGNIAAPGNRHPSGMTYELVTDLLPVEDLPEAPEWAIQMLRSVEHARVEHNDLDLALVEKRRGNIQVIIDRVTKTLPDMARRALAHPDSCPSYSEARYRVIGGLVRIGLPDDEIAALIHYWADTDQLPWGHLDGKSLNQKNGDIVRVIGKHEAGMAQKGRPRIIAPTRGAGLLPSQPIAKPKARDDRPQRLTAAQLLAWYKQEANSGVVLLSQGDVAKAHGISTRTIIRLEQKLGDAIERVSKQHSSHIRLRPSYDNIAALSDLETAPIIVSDAENSEAPSLYKHASLSDQAGDEESHARGGETVTPENPSSTAKGGVLVPAALDDAVMEVFDAYADRPLLPRRKGKPRRAPLTRRMVETYVTSNYPALAFTDEQLKTAIEDERHRRKLAEIPHMTAGTLKAEIRHAEHLIDKSREAGDQAWRWWVVYRNEARAELSQRPPAPNRPKGGRKPCEAIPDPREVARARQAEFWALADIALADMRGASHGKVDGIRTRDHAGDRRERARASEAFSPAPTAPRADSEGGGGDRTSAGPAPACAGEATTAGAALTPDAAHLISWLKQRSAGLHKEA